MTTTSTKSDRQEDFALPKEEESSSSFCFQDTSEDCAICLLPLDDGDNRENDVDDDDENDNNNKNVITLTCGHRWHLSCLKEQLEHAQPNPAKRLVFTGCTCAKCGTICTDHPLLRGAARKIDSLRRKVEELMVREQLLLEDIDSDGDEKMDDNSKIPASSSSSSSRRGSMDDEQKKMERAWRKHAFYLCANCKDPYYGGTIECADQVDGEILAAKDRLCVACSSSSSSSQVACRNRTQHRSFLVWKCRFCCQPSRYVCYGKVHFCDSCHARNTERVRQGSVAKGGDGRPSQPPPLEPVPCPGGRACPFPKPDNGQDRHVNVPTSDGEQVYGCTLCQSSSAINGNGNSSRWDIPEGSRNLIINPSGQDGLSGWQQLRTDNNRQRLRRNTEWQVETSDLPAIPAVSGPQQQQQPPPPSTNFVSTFMWCSMAQTVPIHRYVRGGDLSQARIEVAAQYRGRTDCPSVFRLEAVALDRHGRPIHRVATDILNAPQDDWDRASLVLDGVGAHSVALIVHGKDGRFWQGLYGAKVADCSVRLLGGAETIRQQLVLDNNNNINNNNEDVRGLGRDDGNVGVLQQQRGGLRNGRGGQGDQDPWKLLFQQAVLPVVSFLLFYWLVRD